MTGASAVQLGTTARSGRAHAGGLRAGLALATLFAACHAAAWASGTTVLPPALTQAIMWLPSGVAILGVGWLGPRALVAIALATTLHRLFQGSALSAIWPQAIGSAAEAWLGWWMLRRLGFEPRCARLRDALVLFAVAAVAPLASIAASFLGRSIPGTDFHEEVMLSGWLGWWRMNVLGILAVVPVACAWRMRTEWLATRAQRLRALCAVTVALGYVWFVMVRVPPSATAITVLDVLLPLALVVALRLGSHAAMVVASAGAIFVAVLTMRGCGPFMSLEYGQRHVPAQILLLVLVSVPLVLAALIAERGVSTAVLLRSEELRRALFAVLPDTTCRVAADGTIVDYYLADGQARWLPEHARPGDRIAAVVPADLRPRLARAFDAAAGGARPEPFEQSLAVGGQVRTFEFRLLPTTGGEVLLVARDVTAQKELEQQLRHAQKLEATGLLASGVAHDFNNLLTVISGNAEALRDHELSDDEQRHAIGELVDACQRGARLTGQLLAFSRQQVLAPSVLELTAVVDQVAQLLRRLLGASIRTTIRHGGPVWVRADRGQLEQIVMNLALNARDAMGQNGELTIATQARALTTGATAPVGLPAGDYAELLVRDDGSGMSPEVLAHAFEPFFTTKPPGRGSGLGLSTVHGIVHQSGGTVAIDSAVGAGTTVRILLPAVAAPLAAPPVDVAVGPGGGGQGTLLVVDDEAPVRELLERVLARAGYRVLAAGDGPEAIQQAAEHEGDIDLLVTDLVMPWMGGVDLARRLGDRIHGRRALFLSGHPRETEGLAVGDSRATAFLAKPFQVADLLERVATLLAQGRGAGA